MFLLANLLYIELILSKNKTEMTSIRIMLNKSWCLIVQDLQAQRSSHGWKQDLYFNIFVKWISSLDLMKNVKDAEGFFKIF